MTYRLSAAEYAAMKVKVANLRARLAAIQARTDVAPPHRAEVVRSYEDMIGQMVKERRLYEAAHPEECPAAKS